MTTFVASCLLCSMSPVDTHPHMHSRTHTCLYPFSLQVLASPRLASIFIFTYGLFSSKYLHCLPGSAVYDIGFSHFTFPISIASAACPPCRPLCYIPLHTLRLIRAVASYCYHSRCYCSFLLLSLFLLLCPFLVLVGSRNYACLSLLIYNTKQHHKTASLNFQFNLTHKHTHGHTRSHTYLYTQCKWPSVCRSVSLGLLSACLIALSLCIYSCSTSSFTALADFGFFSLCLAFLFVVASSTVKGLDNLFNLPPTPKKAA